MSNVKKTILSVMMFAVLVVGVCLFSNVTWAAYTPSIETSPTLPQDDVVVYTEKVTDFGAVPNNSSFDNTTAFQQAIDEAYANGGGIVYVPAGHWRLNGTLVLKRKVTLRGEWRNPDIAGNESAQGTILETTANQNNPGGAPFIKVASNATVKNLSIWYPNQSFSSPSSYPAAMADGAFDADDDFHHGFAVVNVTIYNAYKGIATGNTLYSQEPLIRNVMMTVLNTGVHQKNDWNFGNTESVHVSTKYWVNSGLAGAPSSGANQTILQSYTRANLTGVVLDGHIDGINLYDIRVEDANVGIECANRWTQITNISLNNVNTGVYYHYAGGLNAGNSLVGGTINVLPGSNTYGIKMTQVGQVLIQGITIGGTPTNSVYFDSGTETLNLMKMTFNGWTDSAVKVIQGTALIEASSFNAGGTHISLDSRVKSASILGNAFTGSPSIVYAPSPQIYIDHTPLGIPDLPSIATAYTMLKERKPANPNNFYNITTYGAVSGISSSSTDNTTAIQNALNAASSAGGGTVFVPAGYWMVKGQLTIPTGVELRGVAEAASMGDNRGSTLFSYANKNNAGGTPFITLNAASGLRGIMVYYPEMGTSKSTTYPYSIKGNGNNIWIRDVRLINSWNGIDLASVRSDNFELSGVSGNVRNVGTFVSNGSTGGKMENQMQAWTGEGAESAALAFPNNTYRGNLSLASTASPWLFGNTSNITALQLSVYLPDTGVDAQAAGLRFVNNGGTTNNFTCITCQTDASSTARVDAGGTINLVDFGGTQTGLITGSAFAGTLNVFGYRYADHGTMVNMNGGTLNAYQFTASPEDIKFQLNGGTSNFYGTNLTYPSPYTSFNVGASITAAKIVGGAGAGGIGIANGAGSKLTASYNVDTKYVNKTATATSSVEDANWGVQDAVDGNPNSVAGSMGWSSNSSLSVNHTEALTVDIGSVKSLGRVDLYPRNDGANTGYGFPVNFTIQVSTNGSAWTTVVTRTGYALPGNAAQSFTFAPQAVRYVKIEGTSLRQNPNDGNLYRMQFAEASLLAVAGVSATSSVEDASWGISRLTDGNLTSAAGSYGWTSSNNVGTNHTESVTLDLGMAQPITTVNLYPRSDGTNAGYGFPVDFTIQLSADGTNWTTVVTRTAYPKPSSGGAQSFVFTAQTARYVKIEGTSLRQNPNDGNLYRMQLAEALVY
ncbi:discoidin domain-containing protein [Cohnella ginsengisoli]|uniref:Discoidin domain-containing protein n=1 Tax=Cohnella ginsengisoli TaxID=425004 RepID=A0A9X4KEE0_9BACL|nr:discoidin domain-containing protein [Cohnella ginsengisoli]MDG0790246.1 discoidin domain-containing protein [Cohnella ginsengisoli]